MKLSMLAAPTLLVLAGCVTDQATAPAPKPLVNYVPSLQPGKSLDALRSEVETILGNERIWFIRRNFKGHSRIAGMPDAAKISFSDDGVFMTFAGVGYYDYDKPKEPTAHTYQFNYAELADLRFDSTTCTANNAPLPHNVEISYNGVSVGPEVCDALFALGQRIRHDGGRTAATFAEQAARYRALPVKPVLSEELRRLIVQAETLRERKDYAGAIGLFRQALRQDPVAYPAGYFNLALLYEQQENYLGAAETMKKYLLLQPDAKDARAAQDKIYSWEVLAQGK